MSNVLRRKAFLVSSLALAIGAGNAVAGGFEKATMWDAKYSALGGAAVSSVNNSSAIFYNPAGLARIESNDLSLHVSPTQVQANGPANGSDYMKGEKGMVTNGGFTGANRINDRLVVGYGIFGAGGASANYKDVTVGGFGLRHTGDYSTDIKVIEAGLGLGYQVNDNWSIGGSYRITYAYADINMLSAMDVDLGDNVVTAGGGVGYNDMSGFDYFGVRLGAMYRSDDNRWGWGLNYRSEVSIDADGKHNMTVGIGGGMDIYKDANATAQTSLPMQISTGLDYALSSDLTLFGEVTYSNYSAIDTIKFKSDEADLAVPQLNTNWNDQWNFRLATEYTGIEGWALRAGYIYTTSVVPEEYAAPTFSTPAAAHTITFGAGTSFLQDKLLFDVAAEYSRAKNTDVKGGGNLTDSTLSAPGRYDSKAVAVHASVRYMY